MSAVWVVYRDEPAFHEPGQPYRRWYLREVANPLGRFTDDPSLAIAFATRASALDVMRRTVMPVPLTRRGVERIA